MYKIIFILLYFVISQKLMAQDQIVGLWKTIDDASEEPKSVLKLYEKDGLYYGEVFKLFLPPEDDQDPLCGECTDHRKNQRILGMEIVSEMKYNKRNEIYEKGEIMDPENGNIYDCKIWIDDNGNLKVRGYLLFFYRTQTWLPYVSE